MDPGMEIDLDTTTQEILLAASNHDLDALKPFLRVPGAASVQDPESGMTPLHAAIAACGPAPGVQSAEAGSGNSSNGNTNGEAHDQTENGEDDEVDLEKAKATVKELFLSGAIWNDLDLNNETPGCLAWRLGQKELYDLVVEAGLRAEILMNLMGGYEQLPDDDEDSEVEEEIIDISTIPDTAAAPTVDDETAAPTTHIVDTQSKADVNSADYLASSLQFTTDKLLDSDTNGVMMAWETTIMEKSAALLAPTPGLRILNVGFGMGIVDRLFAATQPSSHHIIEAHPAVIENMRSQGSDFGRDWEAKAPGKFVVHEGRWQDVVPELLENGEMFDAIYFDTFGEDYSALKEFFSEYVVGLLDPAGKFGFFNGLGADRRVCYDVYTKVVDVDLCDAGFDTDWTEVAVEGLGGEGEGEWEGVKRRYWTLDKYRLPVCTFMG